MMEYYLTGSPVTWDLFSRFVGSVFLCHHISYYLQIVPLVGDRGLYPITKEMSALEAQYTDRKELLKRSPHLLWFSGTSNHTLRLFCLFGAVCSVLVMLSPSYFWILWFYLFCSNMTLYQCLGPFVLQTEPMIVEINFLMCISSLLVYVVDIPNFVTPDIYNQHSQNDVTNHFGTGISLWLFRWMVTRLMFSAGLVKWFGSPTWRDGTAMTLHYFTQPLVNPLTRYIHYLPQWIHRWSIWGTFVIEGPIPFIAFLPFQLIRWLVVFSFVQLMVMINISGNYAYLGYMTSVLSLSIISDAMLPGFVIDLYYMIPAYSSFAPVTGFINFLYNHIYIVYLLLQLVKWCFVAPVLAVIGIHTLLGLQCVLDQFRTSQYKLPFAFLTDIRRKIAGYALVNHYGMFGAMHNYRWEIMIEGSDDGKLWKNYKMYYKVNNADDNPAFMPIYYWARLDWMIWFLPLRFKSTRQATKIPFWYENLLHRLLENDKEVLGLFKENPFPLAPPKYIRTVVYDYSYAAKDGEEARKEAEEVVADEIGKDTNTLQLPLTACTFFAPQSYSKTKGVWWNVKGPVATYTGVFCLPTNTVS